MDVVVTVPKDRWAAWLAEGDLPGDEWSQAESYFHIGGALPQLVPGERVYVVAYGKLRGYASLVYLHPAGYLVRRSGAVAVTIPESIPGFRGWRYRWWNRKDEVPFPNWREVA